MGAALALQGAVVSALHKSELLEGVFYDAPARAAFPYAAVTCAEERDWSCKGRDGREISLQVVLWDDRPGRLLEIEDQVNLQPASLDVGGSWRISSLVMTSTRRVRDPDGPWSASFMFRVRLLARSQEQVS